MTAAALPARRSYGLGRIQIIGLIYGFFGVGLLAYVAPNLEAADKGFTFEQPPNPATITFDPRNVVVAIAIVFVITAAVSLAGPAFERAAHVLVITSTIIVAPLALVLALALSETGNTNVVALAAESLRLGTPFVLGAMAGLWCERSGVVNIAIEGMMLAAAGVGFTVYAVLGDADSTFWLWGGILAGILTGGLIGALHSLVTVSFRVDQIISGVVINLLALGLTSFLRSQVIVPRGISTGRSTSPIEIPGLTDIPFVGEELFANKPLFYAMFVIVIATWFVLFKTPWGLPRAVERREPARRRDRGHQRHQDPLPGRDPRRPDRGRRAASGSRWRARAGSRTT